MPEALDKLVAHGSVEQIVEHLKQEQVVGWPERVNSCIIAQYVKASTLVDFVSVWPQRITVSLGYEGPEVSTGEVNWYDKQGLGQYVNLPPVLSELARNFDKGEYPELVAEKGKGL